jgi:hypothetical protein
MTAMAMKVRPTIESILVVMLTLQVIAVPPEQKLRPLS